VKDLMSELDFPKLLSGVKFFNKIASILLERGPSVEETGRDKEGEGDKDGESIVDTNEKKEESEDILISSQHLMSREELHEIVENCVFIEEACEKEKESAQKNRKGK
jgi:hypothetical protein